MNFEELSEQRRRTEAISTLLLTQLKGHLETLQPLFTPHRLLGIYAGGKVEVAGAEGDLRVSFALCAKSVFGG